MTRFRIRRFRISWRDFWAWFFFGLAFGLIVSIVTSCVILERKGGFTREYVTFP